MICFPIWFVNFSSRKQSEKQTCSNVLLPLMFRLSMKIIWIALIFTLSVSGQRSLDQCEWNYDCQSCVESSGNCMWSVSKHPYSPFLVPHADRTFQCTNKSGSFNVNGTAESDVRVKVDQSNVAEDIFSKTTVLEYCSAVNNDYRVMSLSYASYIQFSTTIYSQ